jgi:hypothetical protein
LLHACAIGDASVARDWCADGSERQLGEVGGLADRKHAGYLDLDDKKAPAHRVAAAILHRRAKCVYAHGCFGLEIVEDGAALEVIADSLSNVVAHSFEQRMAGRHPLQRWVGWKERFFEDDLLVLAAKSAETRLEAFTYRLKRARYLPDAEYVSVFLDWFRVNAGDGVNRSGDENARCNGSRIRVSRKSLSSRAGKCCPKTAALSDLADRPMCAWPRSGRPARKPRNVDEDGALSFG